MISIPDEAERYDLDTYLGSVEPWYHLFVNDLVPVGATILDDFVEATWPDYAPRKVTSWVPSVTVDGRAVATADPTTWTRGSGGPGASVYGYYVTDGSSGPLIWCERRAAGPIDMTMPTDSVQVLPRLTLREDEVVG